MRVSGVFFQISLSFSFLQMLKTKCSCDDVIIKDLQASF